MRSGFSDHDESRQSLFYIMNVYSAEPVSLSLLHCA